MSPQRLDDRYKSRILQPNESSRDADLINLMAANGERGAVFHVLNHIPEQYEDIYTVLIDDRSVVTLEIPRAAGALTVKELDVFSLRQYRDELGQGKRRIRLDRAVEDARTLLDK
ncbi:hypothetical protein JQ617_19435 [Bradyrhizobium sp. KB893862 SZCCT0404]|uniref:hypothetical protein n=1 Tax=Bradyrhizobium sp. KB893862 SZCCT0404 TaxID=2807672 RepID=UPI001BAE4883|nr:hypothetical protein [Bradyrhizobium sp. KB893862 SZCCT0404]MBR1176137.1 hypothetical protein [Bradyrhizobium sp. KB893862 SZCCT0404]